MAAKQDDPTDTGNDGEGVGDEAEKARGEEVSAFVDEDRQGEEEDDGEEWD